MKAIVLRLDAPLMSFGSVMVDHHGFIDRFPGTSMLTGLLGNALGWDHQDTSKLASLQDRLRFAARWDVRPIRIVDYQTVDLSQAKLCIKGWTTRGTPEYRKGGISAKLGTHIRLRHYWADGLMTVVLTLMGDESPEVEELLVALKHPKRPLFIGRKTCLPARPVLDPETPLIEGDGLQSILAGVPVWDRRGVAVPSKPVEACWPYEEGGGEIDIAYDRRDWLNNLPAGQTRRRLGLVGGEQ